MRVRCQLRYLRGDRPLREMEYITQINRGYLSRWERGIELPPDKYVPILEEAYGAPAEQWFTGHVWLEITDDTGEPL